ncbi:hypothetical protein AOLI_G00142690 [Acnodon oligacanthus]
MSEKHAVDRNTPGLFIMRRETSLEALSFQMHSADPSEVLSEIYESSAVIKRVSCVIQDVLKIAPCVFSVKLNVARENRDSIMVNDEGSYKSVNPCKFKGCKAEKPRSPRTPDGHTLAQKRVTKQLRKEASGLKRLTICTTIRSHVTHRKGTGPYLDQEFPLVLGVNCVSAWSGGQKSGGHLRAFLGAGTDPRAGAPLQFQQSPAAANILGLTGNHLLCHAEN